MNPARVGVKYCGGCREQFFRKAEFLKVKDAFSSREAEFVQAEGRGTYDALIVVCGCQSRCADISEYETSLIVTIDNKGGYQSAVKAIKNIIGQEMIS